MALEFELVILLTFRSPLLWMSTSSPGWGVLRCVFARIPSPTEPPAMRKMTWAVTSPSKPRCEICKGGFGLIRYRIAQKQFCSKQCLERYLAERMQRVSSFQQSIAGLRARDTASGR